MTCGAVASARSRTVMYRAAMLLGLVVAAAPTARSQSPAKTESSKPIATMAWLVGGVWTADASSMAPGLTIETRYSWSDNSAYIRFTTHFLTDKGTHKGYDGNFFWDAAQSTLGMWYMDGGSAITQSPVVVNGPAMVMRWRGPDFEGKPADLRVTVTRRSDDAYSWVAEEAAPGDQWKHLAALEYRRVPGT